jgi:hypothetical protein
MELGVMILEYTCRGSPPITKRVEEIAAAGHWRDKIRVKQGQPSIQEVTLLAGLTRLDVVFWGFECSRCRRYARKLFLPYGKVLFLCRTCHGLRYLSQAKLDLISRRLDGHWDLHSRAMGLPNEKFYRAVRRAGLCIYPFRVPSRI